MPLFCQKDLFEALRSRKEAMRIKILELSSERMNGASDCELIEHFVEDFRVEPLVVHDDKAEAEYREAKVDVSGDPKYAVFDRSGNAYVRGQQFVLHIPFTGDPDLVHTRPSQFGSSPPRGSVQKQGGLGGIILVSCSLPSDRANEQYVNSWIKDSIQTVKKYARWVSYDVERFNAGLEKAARSAIEKRRQELETQGALLKRLMIPIRKRSDAPSPSPVPMPKRVVKPLPPKRQVEQEYEIRNEDYEYILKVIRHGSRSFEASPEAFGKLSEEELRDVVLANLNGHFEGDATGERFRKKGKTDICIEYENRAAFVAECKLWKGEKALHDGIDQLLGYLTWRDTRTALVFWNKRNKDFSKLQGQVRGFFEAHPSFVRWEESGYSREWRAMIRSQDDEGRSISVHVFLVDLGAQLKDEA